MRNLCIIEIVKWLGREMRLDTEREELKVKILEVLLGGEKGIEEISSYTGRKEEVIKEVLKSLESQTLVEQVWSDGEKKWTIPEGKIKLVKEILEFWRERRNK